MDNVQFEGENNYVASPRAKTGGGSFLTRMAMKMGAKTPEQAQKYLLGVVVVVVLITLLVLVM